VHVTVTTDKEDSRLFGMNKMVSTLDLLSLAEETSGEMSKHIEHQLTFLLADIIANYVREALEPAASRALWDSPPLWKYAPIIFCARRSGIGPEPRATQVP